MIYVENKKKSLKTLAKLYPNAEIVDVTSKGDMPFVKLSPFYPHGGIPIPFSPNCHAQSVEGIWQGLKVFEYEDVDSSKFEIVDMKGIKRSVRKFGKPLGHRKGVNGTELFDYLTARNQIYLPSYAWVLQNKTVNEIELLVKIAQTKDLILLDYETNCDIENASKPLAHAALVKKFIDKKYPEIETTKHFVQQGSANDLQIGRGSTNETIKKKKPTQKKKGVTDSNGGQLTMDF